MSSLTSKGGKSNYSKRNTKRQKQVQKKKKIYIQEKETGIKAGRPTVLVQKVVKGASEGSPAEMANVVERRSKVQKAEVLYSGTAKLGSTLGTNVMLEQVVVSTDSLRIMALTYASYVYQQGILQSVQNSTGGVWWSDFAAGLSYLGQSIQSISQGTTQDVVNVPRIFDVLAELCKEKRALFKGSMIRYTPEWTTAFSLSEGTELPNGSIYGVVGPVEPPAYPVPCSTSAVIPANTTGYSFLLRAAEGAKAFGGLVVEQGARPSMYTNDPSIYARVYPYFGQGGTNFTGCYNEAELETAFNYPGFSRFVAYDKEDTVISRIFRPVAGGPSTIIGESLVAPCNYQKLRNPIPTVYKFLDLNQVFMVLCSWAVNLIQEAEGFVSTDFAGFSFTQKEFLYLIRQAILTQFPSQCHAQFVSPIGGIPSSTVSVFMPLLVDSLGAPLPQYSTMAIPQVLSENLAWLKAFQVAVDQTANSARYGNTPTSLAYNYCPVWGVWSGDVVPDYQYKAPDGTFHNLFQTGPPTIPDARLWDLTSTAAANTKIDINFGLAQVMTEWNQFCVNAKNRSTLEGTMSSDTSKFSLLHYTRVLRAPTDQYGASVPSGQPKNAFNAPLYQNIKTLPRGGDREKVLEKTHSKNKTPVQAVVPSTYFDLKTISITSQKLMPGNFLTLLQYFITPTIRLTTDPLVADELSMQAYQVYTGELATASTSLGNIVSDNEVARNYLAGANMTSGLFAGDADNDIYSSMVAELTRTGSGNDLIKTLMGGLASMIPVVGPAVSSLISGL